MNIKLLFLPIFETDVSGNEINPSRIPPLGLATLKGYMEKKGIDIDLDDLSIKSCKYNSVANDGKRIDFDIFNDRKKIKKIRKNEKYPELKGEGEKILNLTNLNGYDIIGFSIINSINPSSVTIPIVLSKLIKEKYDSMLIMGGNITDEVGRKILEYGNVDYRIFGGPRTSKGEINLFNFIENYENGNLDEVEGASYFKDGKYICKDKNYTENEKSKVTKPNFDGLLLETYKDVMKDRTGERFLVLPYFSSRGCPNNCAYCCNSLESFFRTKDLDKTIEDIKSLSNKYNTKYFLFLDNEIYTPKKYAKALLESNLNIKYSICADLQTLDSKSIKLLEESGAVRLIFGLETGSPRLQSYINKNIDLKRAKNVLKLCSKGGMKTVLTLICGFPWERESDVEKTLEFLLRNKSYIDNIELNKFFLGGQILENPDRFDIQIKESNDVGLGKSRYFIEKGGWNKPKIMKHRKRAYKTIMEFKEKYFGKTSTIGDIIAKEI